MHVMLYVIPDRMSECTTLMYPPAIAALFKMAGVEKVVKSKGAAAVMV